MILDNVPGSQIQEFRDVDIRTTLASPVILDMVKSRVKGIAFQPMILDNVPGSQIQEFRDVDIRTTKKDRPYLECPKTKETKSEENGLLK